MQKVNTASLDQLFTGARISGANANARKLSGASEDFQSIMSGTSAQSQTSGKVQKTEGTIASKENVSKNMTAGQKVDSVEQQPQDCTTAMNAAKGDVVSGQQAAVETAEVSESVKEAVQEILGIDEDTMEAVMEEMGITAVQLLDPFVLQQFIMTVHGSSDVTEFLTGEDMMNEFSELLQVMQDLTGVEREDLPQLADFLMQGMQDAEQPETAILENDLLQTVPADAEGQEEMLPVMEGQNVPEETADAQESFLIQGQPEQGEAEQQLVTEQETVHVQQAAKEVLENQPETVTVKNVVHNDIEMSDDHVEEQTEDTTDTPIVSVAGQKTAEESFSEQNPSGNSQMMQQPQSEWQSRSTVIRREPTDSQSITMTQFVENMMQAVSEETGTQSSNPVQMFQIVNQVVEQIRTHMQDGSTTMEMQLNPESLGKVLLSVTNKDGVMTASFTVQTTEAKEALESQMQVLRENLEQKNLKVEAVEVSVSDFSFSQSSMAEDQKNFKQGNGKAHRFQFEEEEEEDAAAEAEQVRESVMRDSGSSIDFTA